jgi:hypothetical protein
MLFTYEGLERHQSLTSQPEQPDKIVRAKLVQGKRSLMDSADVAKGCSEQQHKRAAASSVASLMATVVAGTTAMFIFMCFVNGARLFIEPIALDIG